MESRQIKWKDLNSGGTKLNLVTDNAIEPADELEEYHGIINPKQRNPARIEARRQSYLRYR